MKKILMALLICPMLSFAQVHHTYFQVSADMYNYSSADPVFGGSLEIGGKGSIMGFGAGISLLQFKGASSPYIPLYADICLYTNQRKLRPVLQLKGGYGVYSNSVSTIKQSGGAYLNPSAGVLLPVKKRDLIFALGYLYSEITTKFNNGYTQSSVSGHIGGWSLNVGIKL